MLGFVFLGLGLFRKWPRPIIYAHNCFLGRRENMPLLVSYQVKNLFQGIDWKSTVGRAGKMKTLLMIIVPIAMVHGRRPTIATPSASLGTLMTSENNIWASFSVWLR